MLALAKRVNFVLLHIMHALSLNWRDVTCKCSDLRGFIVQVWTKIILFFSKDFQKSFIFLETRLDAPFLQALWFHFSKADLVICKTLGHVGLLQRVRRPEFEASFWKHCIMKLNVFLRGIMMLFLFGRFGLLLFSVELPTCHWLHNVKVA